MRYIRTSAQSVLLIFTCFLTFPLHSSESPCFTFDAVDPIVVSLCDLPTQVLFDSSDQSVHIFLDSFDLWHFYQNAGNWVYEKLDFDIRESDYRGLFEKSGQFYIVSDLPGDEISIVRGNTLDWKEIERITLPGFSGVRAAMDPDGAIWIVSDRGLIQRYLDGEWLTQPMILDSNLDSPENLMLAITADVRGRVSIAYALRSLFPGCRVVRFDQGADERYNFEEYLTVRELHLDATPDGGLVLAYGIMVMPERVIVHQLDTSGFWTSDILIEPDDLKLIDMDISNTGSIGLLVKIGYYEVLAENSGTGWSMSESLYSDSCAYASDDRLYCPGSVTLNYRTNDVWASEDFYRWFELDRTLTIYSEGDDASNILLKDPFSDEATLLAKENGIWTWTDFSTDLCQEYRSNYIMSCFTALNEMKGLVLYDDRIKFFQYTPESVSCVDFCSRERFDSVLRVDADADGRLNMLLTEESNDSNYWSLLYHVTGIPPEVTIRTLEVDDSYSFGFVDSTVSSDGSCHIIWMPYATHELRYIRVRGNEILRQTVTDFGYNDYYDSHHIALGRDTHNQPLIVDIHDSIDFYQKNAETWRQDRMALPEELEQILIEQVRCVVDTSGRVFILFVERKYSMELNQLHCLEYTGHSCNLYHVSLPIEGADPEAIAVSNKPGEFAISGRGLFTAQVRSSLPAFDMELNDVVFEPGDVFELNYAVENDDSEAEYTGVCLLEVPVGDTSLFYSIPNFSPVEEGIERIEFNLAPNEERRGELCRFTWPHTDHSRDNLGIWSALLSPDLGELKSKIYRRSFSYRMSP